MKPSSIAGFSERLGPGGLVVVGLLLFSALLGVLALIGRPRVSLRVPEPPRARLVVLPFRNLAADPALEPVCRSLAEAVVAEIQAGFGERFSIVAPQEARMFPGAAASPERAATRLDARYVLEGALDRDEGDIVAAIQLVRLHDRRRLWSERYRTAPPASDLESQVVEDAVRALQFLWESSELAP